MMEMTKLVKKAVVGTMTGAMVAAAPLAAFAAEEKAEPETAVEELATEAMDGEEAVDEEVDWDAVMNELYTELEAMGVDVSGALTDENNQEEDEMMEQAQAIADFLCSYVEDAEVRSATIQEVMDYFGVDMPEEEKQALADILANATWEDWKEAGAAFVEYAKSDEFQQLLDEVEAAEKKECAEQLEEALNELGQALIDVTVEDIMTFLA